MGIQRILDSARIIKLKRQIRNLGKNVVIYPGALIVRPDLLDISDGVSINIDVRIMGGGGCKIGCNTMLGPNVMILTTQHDSHAKIMKSTGIHKLVKIGNNSWIGGGAILLPGVTIGDNCIVGAGAVVTRDVADGEMAVGIPARSVRSRNLEKF